MEQGMVNGEEFFRYKPERAEICVKELVSLLKMDEGRQRL
jgi:hypothetical protein